MKYIFIKIQPFDFQQQIKVYNDEEIDTFKSSIINLPSILCEITNKYNIQEINIAGPFKYIKHIEQQTKKKEIEQYQSNNLIFKYI